MCPYNFYNENDNYFPYLYCSIDGKRCLYSKKCNKEQRYIPLDNQGECYKMNEKVRKEIPTNSYFVKTTRQSKHGTWLYVEIGDKIEKIEIPIENYDKNYVYIKVTKDGKKLASETPFRTYGKKKKKN